MENALRVDQSHDIERRASSPIAAATPSPETQTRVVEVRPRLDVLENGEAIRVVVDVPGVDAANADVQVEMPNLRISCTRATSRQHTIRYAATLTLPASIDPGSLTAQLENGVLEIAMQKSAQARARRIEIRRG